MKGIILAGGTGSRLAPLTKTENKHLLPVYNKKMIEYPLATLVEAGLTDVVIVTGGNNPGTFIEYLKDGKDFGLTSLAFTYQHGSGGVAAALKCAQPCLDDEEPCVVVLGDNYFEESIRKQLNNWWQDSRHEGAVCLLRQTDTPWHFGIAEVTSPPQKIISIEEKPSEPKSDLAILGCYFFDYSLWHILDTIKPSERGELEITDVLKAYLSDKWLEGYNYNGYWSDMGTFDTWTEVSQRIARRQS